MDIRICKECGFILGTRPNSKDYCNYNYDEQYLADLTLRHFSQAFILRNYKEYYQEFQVDFSKEFQNSFSSLPSQISPACQFRAWHEKGGKRASKKKVGRNGQ